MTKKLFLYLILISFVSNNANAASMVDETNIIATWAFDCSPSKAPYGFVDIDRTGHDVPSFHFVSPPLVKLQHIWDARVFSLPTSHADYSVIISAISDRPLPITHDLVRHFNAISKDTTVERIHLPNLSYVHTSPEGQTIAFAMNTDGIKFSRASSLSPSTMSSNCELDLSQEPAPGIRLFLAIIHKKEHIIFSAGVRRVSQ